MKIRKLDENYRVLDEATLNRLVNQHGNTGYVVLSASRGYNSEAENNRATEQLKKDVKSLGYSYVPVYGGYVEENGEVFEKSLFVMPFKAVFNKGDSVEDFSTFEEDMIELGEKYEQESILICRPNESPVYYDIASGTFGTPFKGQTSFKDTTKQYFTALKKKGDQRFSFNECYMEQPANSIMDGHRRALNGEVVDMKYFSKNR